MSRPRVSITTDGSGTTAIPNGGYAAILRFETPGGVVERIVTGQILGATTNIKCEMSALIYGLKALTRPCEVVLTTDLQMLSRGINEWLDGWSKNNWRNKAGKRIENPDLWQEIHALMLIHKVTAQWTRGHVGHELNEKCDRLAGEARLGELTNTVQFIKGAQL